MSVGLGIFFTALGAILAFAVKDAVPGIDLEMVGWIVMVAGIVTVVLSLVLQAQARRRAAVDPRQVPPPTEPYRR